MSKLKVFLLLILVFTITGCVSVSKNMHEIFHVNDIYYQSWMVQDTEKGTDIIIDLIVLDDNVEFKTLVFRGIEVDVSEYQEGRRTILKGVINTGPSLIESYEYETNKTDDMVNYSYNGRDFSYPLVNIQRRSTRFIN